MNLILLSRERDTSAFRAKQKCELPSWSGGAEHSIPDRDDIEDRASIGVPHRLSPCPRHEPFEA